MTFQADLEKLFGLKSVTYKYNLGKKELFHEAIANDRGRVKRDGPSDAQKAFPTVLGDAGPLVYYTDPDCTGRRTRDTYAVKWPEVADEIWFKADLNAYDPDQYQGLLKRVIEHVNNKQSTLYVKDVFMGSDPDFAVPYRFVGEYATHAMFVHNMFPKDLQGVKDIDDRRWTMINVPSFVCEPDRDGCRSEAAVVVDTRNRICLVAGRADYCGVNKKTIFTVGNYLLPKQERLSMHCSANVGANNDAAILFGLSGTGKTTLSADASRRLIGDDETIWSDNGLCNLEDGCYAKLINLDKAAEPVIAAAMSQPGTIASADHRAADRRCIRCPATDFHPGCQGCDVSLRVRLYRSRCRYRGGCNRTTTCVQCLLWWPLHVAEAQCLRQAAGEEDGNQPRTLHPAQYRLERRQLRHWQAHVHQGHASTAQCCA